MIQPSKLDIHAFIEFKYVFSILLCLIFHRILLNILCYTNVIQCSLNIINYSSNENLLFFSERLNSESPDS